MFEIRDTCVQFLSLLLLVTCDMYTYYNTCNLLFRVIKVHASKRIPKINNNAQFDID